MIVSIQTILPKTKLTLFILDSSTINSKLFSIMLCPLFVQYYYERNPKVTISSKPFSQEDQ